MNLNEIHFDNNKMFSIILLKPLDLEKVSNQSDSPNISFFFLNSNVIPAIFKNTENW